MSQEITRNLSGAMAAEGRSPIVPLRTAGTGSPLFCFPGAGGNVGIFEEMTAALPEGQPVYAIDMEPLCESEEQFTIEQLAGTYLEAIREVQRDGPYYVCGYSLGGLVAYEIARRLVEEGESAALVGLLDAANPAMLSNLSQTEAAHFHRTYLIDRLKRYGRNLMQGEIKAFAGRGFAFLVARLGRFLTPAIKRGFRLARRPLPKMLRSNDPVFLKAWLSYVPKRYAQRVVLFRVEERGPEHDRDPSMGWGGCAMGGVAVHVVPGGHVDMMSSPSVRVLARELAAYLDDGSNREESSSCDGPAGRFRPASRESV